MLAYGIVLFVIAIIGAIFTLLINDGLGKVAGFLPNAVLIALVAVTQFAQVSCAWLAIVALVLFVLALVYDVISVVQKEMTGEECVFYGVWGVARIVFAVLLLVL